MSSREELLSLIRQGGEDRARVRLSWQRLEEEFSGLAAETGHAAARAVATLKWGGGALLAAAVLFRLVRFRRGFRGMRWLWSLGPLVARFALKRAVGSRD